MFIGGSLAGVRANIADYRAQARAQGRADGSIKFLAGAAVIVGKTEDEVARKVDEFQRLRSVEGHLAHAGAGLDWTRYAPQTRVGDIVARKDPGYQRLLRQYTPNQTVGEILATIGSFTRGPFFVA